MPNDYYERQSQMDPGGLADGLAIEQEFDAIARAFGKLPKPHRDGGGFEGPTKVGDPENDDDAVNKRTLDEAVDGLKGAGGDAVLDVKWLTKRSPMRTGYAPGDGQTLPRALYPNAFDAIQAGLVPVCSDAEWLADPAKRGCYTLGDGATTFRVPDYNGVQPGSYGPVYLGGGNSAGGAILRDRIQNIVGDVNFSGEPYGLLTNSATATGAFKIGDPVDGRPSPITGSGIGRTLRFDASGSARTGDTTRPITAEGCLAVKLFGAVQNAGSADASVLATAVAGLASRISVLEQRKFTCLVNAVGTGAPHETVSAALPANIAKNSTYTLTNPFGINTPVNCVAEIYVNGRWSKVDGAYNNPNGVGVGAFYVQGIGIILQTGSYAMMISSNRSLSGHGWAGGDITNPVPCRVFVCKPEA